MKEGERVTDALTSISTCIAALSSRLQNVQSGRGICQTKGRSSHLMGVRKVTIFNFLSQDNKSRCELILRLLSFTAIQFSDV